MKFFTSALALLFLTSISFVWAENTSPKNPDDQEESKLEDPTVLASSFEGDPLGVVLGTSAQKNDEQSEMQKKVASQGLVSMQNGQLANFDPSKLDGVDYYGVYFSASWCPPCRQFTPELVNYYNEAKAKNPNFELVMVSADNSAGEMQKYMQDMGMNWPAVNFSSLNNTPLMKYAGDGIPNLIFMDKTGKILSSSYQGTSYVGPRQVISDMKKTLK